MGFRSWQNFALFALALPYFLKQLLSGTRIIVSVDDNT